MEDKDTSRGGARPGSGRKAKPAAQKKVQIVITVEPETRDALRWAMTYRYIRPGKVVDYLVRDHFDADITKW